MSQISAGFWQAAGAGLFVALGVVVVYYATRPRAPTTPATSSTTSGCGCGG